MFLHRRHLRTFVVLLLALVLAAAVYGFAAANTVPTSHAGDGQNTVSGYTVSNIHYELSSTDPTKVSKVSFDLDASADNGGVYAAVGDNSSPTNWTWSNACTNSSGNTWECTFSSPPAVLNVYHLRVVAAGP